MINEFLGWICGMALIAAVIAFIYFLMWAPGAFSCSNKWGDSGFEHRYGVLSGCQIKPNQRWIPAEAYREM